MISGGVRGAGIVTFEKVYPTSNDLRKANPFSLSPRSFSAQCCVADGRRLELLSSPLPGDTGQSASDFRYALQHQYLSLRKEGGIQEWRPRDFSTSRDVPLSRQWPISDVVEAAGAAGEQIGSSGSIEGNGIVDDGVLSAEGELNKGFKLDLVEGIKDLARQAKILKEEVTSFDYTVAPTPYTPVEGTEAVKFVATCVLLVFIFWLGNYYVPDLIFKDTVFRKEPVDPLDPTGTTSGDNLTVSNQESQKGSNGASNQESQKGSNGTSKRDGGSSSIKSGAGFSQKRKQNRPKSSKRK